MYREGNSPIRIFIVILSKKDRFFSCRKAVSFFSTSESFTDGAKLCFSWCGPRSGVKVLSNYVYEVEDPLNGTKTDIHVICLKFYTDSLLETEAVMSHVVSSATGMPFQRILKIVESYNILMVQVRWKKFRKNEETIETFLKVYKDVTQLLLMLLARKNTPADVAAEARRIVHG